MAATKKEALSKLYFLRAMMSKIAAISNEREKLEERIDDIEHRKFVPSVKIEKKVLGYKQEKLKLQSELQEWDKKETNANAEIKRKELEFDVGNKPYSARRNVTFCIKANGIVCLILFFLIKWWVNSGFSFWVGLLTVPITLFGILLIYAFISMSTRSYHNKELRAKEKRIEDMRAELCQIKNQKAQKKEEIKKLENQIQNEEIQESVNSELIKQEYAKFCESNQNERKKLIDTQNKLLSDATAIYESIKALAIIDERDWANLDFVIYELETGRADSMKEALQQADLCIRHNEMIQAIETAGEAISACISQNINDLKHSIGLQVRSLRADINELNKGQRTIAEKLGDMLDAQELSNALLERASESSKDLAKNIEYIKDIKYREYYGIEHL